MDLAVKHISKEYRTGIFRRKANKALKDFSFDFKTGIYGILGPNGAGKSTLFKVMTGILMPDNGEILIDQKRIYEDIDGYRKLIGYVPQLQTLYHNFTGHQFVNYFCALKGLKKKEIEKETARVVSIVGLEESIDRRIDTYSGGMRQRLIVATALINDPSILILDEPMTGLDPQERMTLISLLKEKGTDCIILMSTHIVSDVIAMCNDVLIIDKGGNQVSE